MRPPPGYSSRPADPSDLEAVVDLFEVTDLADAGLVDPEKEHLEDQWRLPSFDLGRDTVLVHAPDGTLATYAEISGHNPRMSLDSHGRVHPEHRGRGLGAGIMVWSRERALGRVPAPRVLRHSVPATDEAALDLLARSGFARVRTFHHIERGLEGEIEAAAPPPGIELRPYRHPADSGAVYDALEESFLDHWGSEPYPREVHDAEIARADPGVTPVAVDGDEIVGVCVSRVIEDGAWVDVLGVRRPWRRRGVARALLLWSFDGLAARGARRVLLNVDSESQTGATRLYQSVGMRVRRAWAIFETPIDAGIS